MACEYGVNNKNSVFCNLSKYNCTFVRWCINSDCIKNTEGYINCKIRSEAMTKKRIDKFKSTPNTNEVDLIENIESKTNNTKDNIEQETYSEKLCKILWIKNNVYAIDFDGFGLSFHVKDGHILDLDLIKDFIKVKYKSKIGKSDFECFPIYD